MSFRQCVPANNDEDVAGAEFKLTCSSGGSSAARAERCRVASAPQRCLAPSAQRADDEPVGVRGVSWTGEHNGDRVRRRSSGFHRRGFLFGALAALATRVNLELNRGILLETAASGFRFERRKDKQHSRREIAVLPRPGTGRQFATLRSRVVGCMLVHRASAE